MTYGNICIVETCRMYTCRVVTLWREGSRPGGLRVIQDLRFSRLAPARLASVCGRVECLPRGFSCLNPFRSVWPADLERLPFDPSKISWSPRREHSKGTRSIDAVDPTVRPTSQMNCLPPTVFSFEKVVPGMKIYLLERYLLPALRSTCMTRLSRCSAAPIARVLPSDIYNSASRRLCIKFCSMRLKG